MYKILGKQGSLNPFILVMLVSLSSSSSLAHSQTENAKSDENKMAGQVHNGPPPGPPSSPEDEAVRKRMGDTSILMGTIRVPDSVASCDTAGASTRLVCLIRLLKDTLSEKQQAWVFQNYSLKKAQTWSNLPAGAVPSRPGIFLGELTVMQRGLVKAIMMEATGSEKNEGFDELVQTLNADDYIGTVSTDYKAGYSSFNTKFAVLGDPDTDEIWQLYYGGHHLAFTNTYKNQHLIGATPSFRGIEPFPAFEMNGRTNIPLLQERDAFAMLLQSFTKEQLKQAKLAGTYRDILAGPQQDDAIPTQQEGLSVSLLNKQQKQYLVNAIETYVKDISQPDADIYMDRYRNEFDKTVIGYAGTPALNSENDYVRIHGPTLWIEISLQSNKSTNQKGNHPHSVWRDQQDDYGRQNGEQQ